MNPIKTKSTNIFQDFYTTCLGFIDILGLCSEPEIETKTKIGVNLKTQLTTLKDELSKNGVEYTFDENNQLDIAQKYNKNHKAVTKYLIKFIADEYREDKDLIEQLNSLPEIGSPEQDKKLIEIADKLARYKDGQGELSQIYLENPEDQIKHDIRVLCENNNKQNPYVQFIREFEDATTNIVSAISAPFELCFGEENSKQGNSRRS